MTLISRLAVLLPLVNGFRINKAADHALHLGSRSRSQETLSTYATRLVDGLSGDAILDMTALARSIASQAFLELIEEPTALCTAQGRRCAPIFRANLQTAHSSVSWEPGHWIDTEITAAQRHGLVVGNVALVRSVDDIFTTNDPKHFMNSHGLWYSVVSAYGCRSSSGDLRADISCSGDEQLAWYVFVGTRGTQGATEVMADFGLYEGTISSQLLDSWERVSVSRARLGNFGGSQLTSLLADLTHPELNPVERNVISHYPEGHPSAHREEPIPSATLDSVSGDLRNVVSDIRTWARAVKDLVVSDANELAEALETLYVMAHTNTVRHAPNHGLFCDNSWLHATTSSPSGCPVSDTAVNTAFVYTGHSVGGTIAQLQGLVAEQMEDSQVAVIAVNAPGVERLSKDLGIRQPRHSWRNDFNDWWNSTFGSANWSPIARTDVDEDQDYSRFLMLVAQHDVMWKVDRPLSKTGQSVCMFFHAPSQSHCKNYTDLSLFVDRSCQDNSQQKVRPQCQSFPECIMTEHLFEWEGAGGQTLQGLKNKRLDTGLLLSDMTGATGVTYYESSSRNMPPSDRERYTPMVEQIVAEFDAKMAPITQERDTNQTALLSRYGEDGKIYDLSDYHCCDFANGTCNRDHNQSDPNTISAFVRSPCNGEHMACSRLHSGLWGFFTHGFSRKCECESGWHYSINHRTCMIVDSTPEELALDAWYANLTSEAEWFRDEQLFHVNQETNFFGLDANYGAEEGMWRCSLAGDESWQGWSLR